MNIKRALGFGALLWIFIFFEVSILMFGFGLKTGGAYYIVHYILAAVLIGIASALYFNDKKARAGFKEGLFVGAIFIATGIILDAVITVPLFIKDYRAFFNLSMLFGYLETVIIAGLIGAVKKK
jgi:NADH:ubiquinone oxidoreductase subunit 6 (subunit J)